VSVRDKRTRAYAEWALRRLGFAVESTHEQAAPQADIWIVDQGPGIGEAVGGFVADGRCAVIVGSETGEAPGTAWTDKQAAGRVVFAGVHPSPADLSAAVRQCLGGDPVK
jgi:hypothetical protein